MDGSHHRTISKALRPVASSRLERDAPARGVDQPRSICGRRAGTNARTCCAPPSTARSNSAASSWITSTPRIRRTPDQREVLADEFRLVVAELVRALGRLISLANFSKLSVHE